MDETLHKCNTCRACFSSIEKVKEHYKSDWHVLNSKRRSNEQLPLTKAEFKQLKPKQKELPPAPVIVPPPEEEEEEEVEELPIGPTISIFDTQEFETIEQCVEHMVNSYGFFIPDVEYLVDLPGLLQYLGEKVKVGGICLYCQKQLRPGRPCQNHMKNKSHCKIAYEEGVDMEEFEDFYDFTSSYDEPAEGDELTTKTVTISPIGELVLLDGRTVGHRDFRIYYKQHHRPEDTRPAILAHQRDELEQLEMRFGGRKTTSEELATMSDTDVRGLLIKYHKELRKGQIVEQRSMLKRQMRDQKRETQSKVDKARSAITTTAIIRDYHKTVM